jgi:hypothetical protein
MALDKFRSNLAKEDLEQQITKKWEDEEIRIKDEILNSFCRFLKSEGFSTNKDEFSAKAQYGTAIISIEVPEYRRVLKGHRPSSSLWYIYNIKYNKWGDSVQLHIVPNVLNQSITKRGGEDSYSGYDHLERNPELFKEYIKNFQPIRYELFTQIENDRSQIGFFGKVFASVNSQNTAEKRANHIKEIIEAVLNDEFSKKGLW